MPSLPSMFDDLRVPSCERSSGAARWRRNSPPSCSFIATERRPAHRAPASAATRRCDRRASRSAASQVKEACREARGVARPKHRAGLPYALRQLRRQPGFALVVVASLGLGSAPTRRFLPHRRGAAPMLPVEAAGLSSSSSPRRPTADPRLRIQQYRRLGTRRHVRTASRRSEPPGSTSASTAASSRPPRDSSCRAATSAPGRPRRSRPHHRLTRRPEPERPSRRGHQPRLLAAAVRARTVGRRPDDCSCRDGLSRSSASRRASSSVSRSGGRLNLRAAHDAADGDAGGRELAGRAPDRGRFWLTSSAG